MSDTDPPHRKKSSADPANLGLFPGAPVVRPVPRRNALRAIGGDGADHKALGRSPFRSLNERDLRTLLGANPAIAHYAVEPHTLEFFVPGGKGGFAKHQYTPDVVCRYRSGEVVVIDAKAAYFATLPGWTFKEAHIREAYRIDHGVAFVVITEHEIRAQPRLDNSRIMERHRFIAPDHEAMARVRRSLVELGLPTTIAAVVRKAGLVDRPPECRAYSAVMNLALSGEVRLDLAKPFNFGTAILEDAQP